MLRPFHTKKASADLCKETKIGHDRTTLYETAVFRRTPFSIVIQYLAEFTIKVDVLLFLVSLV